jgi:gas vesicle protein
MRTGKVLLGTLAGLAIGAIAGILFAPEKGSTTRKQIMDKGDDYVDELKSKVDEFSDSLTEKFKSTKEDAERLVDKGKAKFDDAKKEVKNAAAKLKHDGAADIKHATS